MNSAMLRKLKPPRDDPEQSKRFLEVAREGQADGTKDEFERAFKKIVKSGSGQIDKGSKASAGERKSLHR